MKYYLMDLQRTIIWSCLYYWKENKRGYTNKVSEAGVFSKEAAQHIVDSDLDKNTLMIEADSVNKILTRGF